MLSIAGLKTPTRLYAITGGHGWVKRGSQYLCTEQFAKLLDSFILVSRDHTAARVELDIAKQELEVVRRDRDIYLKRLEYEEAKNARPWWKRVFG